MSTRRRTWKTIRIMLFFLLVVLEQAKAQYIDPGTGSYLLQFLIAGLLAMFFYLKKTTVFFRAMFSKLFKKEDESAQ